MDNNRILAGDCIEQMRQIDSNIARLVIADPPYFNVLTDEDWDTQWANEAEYLDWCDEWIAEAMRLLMPGGLLYCFGQPGKREQAFLRLIARNINKYEYHDLIIWDRVVGYNDRKDSFTPAYEMILVLRKPGGDTLFNKDIIREPYDEETIQLYARDKRYKNIDARMAHLRQGKKATNLWRVPSLKGSSREKIGHPSQKPVVLIDRIVRSSSAEGDLVIDPFLGSGTTAAVAEANRRRWIGIEKDDSYIEMSKRRIGLPLEASAHA